MTTSSGFTNQAFADWTKEQEKKRNEDWAAWNPAPILEQVKTLTAKDARETNTYLKTNKETFKKRLYECLYDNYFEFVGENQLATLKELKSKSDLIGEIIGLLQSPAKNVISGLNAGSKLASILKTLEDRVDA